MSTVSGSTSVLSLPVVLMSALLVVLALRHLIALIALHASMLLATPQADLTLATWAFLYEKSTFGLWIRTHCRVSDYLCTALKLRRGRAVI